jgi:arginase
MHIAKTIEIIGVPSDLGLSIPGCRMGPSCLRVAGIHAKINQLGLNVYDQGDLLVVLKETLPTQRNNMVLPLTELCQQLMSVTKLSLDEHRMPLILGGDHSIAIGTINGVRDYVGGIEKKMGLIWLDAHADFNTPSSSLTGNIHGMPLATILGMGHEPLVNLGLFKKSLLEQNIAIIGLRSIDEPEKKFLLSSGITLFTMRDIDELGMAKVMEQAISIVSNGTYGIHISFDLDSIDPSHACGVSTPVSGGLSIREARLAMEILYDQVNILSMEFVELNPVYDIHNKTANLCIDLIEILLGKKIKKTN